MGQRKGEAAKSIVEDVQMFFYGDDTLQESLQAYYEQHAEEFCRTRKETKLGHEYRLKHTDIYQGYLKLLEEKVSPVELLGARPPPPPPAVHAPPRAARPPRPAAVRPSHTAVLSGACVKRLSFDLIRGRRWPVSVSASWRATSISAA